MNEANARAILERVLGEVAPDAELDGVDPRADLREELGLDSMDVLNFAIGLQEQTGVEVPERDYPLLVTLDGCVRYLVSHGAG
jgi:acyl carrier protein